mmetsp:Transcript_21001/g.25810  ORF Transcript_21001/g.25810 Transcript_21001/m.25810 type:complete len:300 (+) Transcript_21001:302-1201(+)
MSGHIRVNKNPKHGWLRLERLADREDGVAGEGLVDDHASDAHHGSTAVVALSVELPGLAKEELLLANLLGGAVAEPDIVAIRVAGPEPALRNDVTRVLRRVLLEAVDLERRDEDDDLQPRRRGKRCPRGDGTTRDVRELDALRGGEVARPAHAAVGGDDTKEGSHSHASVLDLHLDEPAVALRALLADLEGIPAANRREDANLVVGGDEGADLLVGLASHIKERVDGLLDALGRGLRGSLGGGLRGGLALGGRARAAGEHGDIGRARRGDDRRDGRGEGEVGRGEGEHGDSRGEGKSAF